MARPEWLADVDWDALADEAQQILQMLLRIDTTNPPGNELEACRVIAGLLEAEGIAHELFEVAPGRANLVASVPGRGEAEPILLSTHLDVVPADGDAWTHPPFGGEIADGYIWGRGAVDMKNMAAMELALLLLARRRANGELPGELRFAAVADEEAGCELGSLWLAREHPDAVRARYVFGEVGGFTLHLGETRVCPVQVAEKGICWMRVRAEGREGHGSMPDRDGAIARLGEAAATLTRASMPLHETRVMRRFVERVAAAQPFPKGLVLRQILNPALADVVLERLIPDETQARLFRVLTRNTVAPTLLRAGNKINVIPAAAEMEIDGRTLPGQRDEDLIAEVRQLIGDDLEIEVTRSMPPIDGDPDDPVIAVIQEVMDELDPGIEVIPNTLPGFTDAKAWSSLGATCVGFAPVRLGPEDAFSTLFHGVDERIPVEGFRFGVRALSEVVLRLMYGGDLGKR